MVTDTKQGAAAGSKLKKAVLVCVILLAAELAWLFVINPGMPFSHVEVHTIDGLSRAEALAAGGVTTASSYMSLKTSEVERGIGQIPLVDTVQVVKSFPDTLTVFITPRRAVSLFLANVGGRTEPLFFDHKGVIFKVGGAEAVSANMPVISGISFNTVSAGMRLPETLSPLFTNIEKIIADAPEVMQAISEISIRERAYDGYDLVLYPEHNKVKIRMGQEFGEDTLRYMLLLIDVLAEKGLPVEQLDFRTGTASYTLKDGTNG
jgi:cell division protein FtsQ